MRAALSEPPGAVAAEPPRGGSLRDRFLLWRARLVGRERFRRWAARFPLTRPLARRATARLFGMATGFVHSQVLAACVRLELFERLRGSPQAPGPLGAACALPAEGARALFDAAVALDLLVRLDDGRLALGELGAVVADDPGIRAMVRHHALLYADLGDPLALLRGPRGSAALARYWAYARADDPAASSAAEVSDYSALMAASQRMIAAEVLDAVDLSGSRVLLDVGGGEGAFLCAVGARYPDLQLRLFDLPAVAARAAARFAAEDLSARAIVNGGDFLRDPLPAGADTLSLVRVIHDHDDQAAMTILRAARAALPQGGRLVLAEPMAGTEGAGAVAAYFSLYLHAMGSGRPRTRAELEAMLREAGFAAPRARATATPLLVRVLEARAE